MVLGYLVTFEAGECGGKGTHSKLLKIALNNMGFSVNNSFYEPGSTPKSELLRIVVKNKFDTNFKFSDDFLSDLDFSKHRKFFEQDNLSPVAIDYLSKALNLAHYPFKNEFIKFVLYGNCNNYLIKEKFDSISLFADDSRKPFEVFFGEYFSNEKLDARVQEYLFFAARNILYHNHIGDSLKKFDFTFIDRSIDSTVIYQGHVFNPFRVDAIRRENMRATQGVVPDLTLFLDIPVDEIYNRLKRASRGAYADFFDGQNRAFHEKVRLGYQREFKFYKSLSYFNSQYGRIKKIDANRDIDDVHKSVLEIVVSHFGL